MRRKMARRSKGWEREAMSGEGRETEEAGEGSGRRRGGEGTKEENEEREEGGEVDEED